MKLNSFVKGLLLLGALAVITWLLNKSFESQVAQEATSPVGRAAFELMRLADPETGEIPQGIREQELKFAQTLPISGSQRDSLALHFKSAGPYNVGGRTRAFAVDISNDSVYFAGGVSGGMWKSKDAGQSWTRVTDRMQHAAVSCIAQDKRAGKTTNWYYGSGEVNGNSASKSFSAYYRGNGVYKSTDGGESWVSLESTIAPPQEASDWDAVFSLVVDKTRNDSDIVFAATKKGIMRSNNGGEDWKKVLGPSLSAEYTYVIQNHSGVFYAAISSANTASAGGMWRSEDGLEWAKISAGSIFPSNHERTLIACPDSADYLVYFFSGNPGSQINGANLLKYVYLSGDGTGAGGDWMNLTSGMANCNIDIYNGYCQVLAVKPDDPDVIFIGGTNLYRSTNGFLDTLHNTRIGGYSIDGNPNFTYRSGEHYPDQQYLTWHPTNPNILFSCNDGGSFRANNCLKETMVYDKLNNGLVVAQFYGIAIDHGSPGSEVIIGGLQDRGTFWTNEANHLELWTSQRGADGAYCAVEDGGGAYYMSTQYANIVRAKIASNGNKFFEESVMPQNLSGGYLFVHPFTLDPTNQNRMYLPRLGSVLRNSNLSSVDNGSAPIWQEIANVGGTITTISASESEEGVIYFGTSNGNIYRMDNAHAISSGAQLISNGITKAGYASCIAIDPQDADRVIAVFSNYNTISAWLTEDGGSTWTPIEGNLKGESKEGVPPAFYYIGNGPSFRWAEIIHDENEGEIVLMGTSVGLFSTRSLDGDSTVWKQEGANSIGNVVVDMIDYRASDQWIVVGTHGNGIYVSNMEFVTPTPPASVDEIEKIDQLVVYPNPASDVLFLSTDNSLKFERVQVYNLNGALVKTFLNTSQVNISDLASGQYLLMVDHKGKLEYTKFVKQ